MDSSRARRASSTPRRAQRQALNAWYAEYATQRDLRRYMAAVVNGSVRRALFEWERGAREIAQRKHTMQMVARTLVGMGGEHHRLGTLRRALYRMKSAAMAAVVEAFEKRFQVLEAPPDPLASAAHRRRALRKGLQVWNGGTAARRRAIQLWRGAELGRSFRKLVATYEAQQTMAFAAERLLMGKKARLALKAIGSWREVARARLALSLLGGRATSRSRLAAVRSGIDAFQRTLAVRRIIDSQRRAASTLRYGAAARAAWNVLAEARASRHTWSACSRASGAPASSGSCSPSGSAGRTRSARRRGSAGRHSADGAAPASYGLPRAVRAAGDAPRAPPSTLPPDPPQRLARDGDVASRGGGARRAACRGAPCAQFAHAARKGDRAAHVERRCRDERRLRRRHLVRGFDALCQAEMRGRRVRAIAARSARHMMHAATSRALRAWCDEATARAQAKLVLDQSFRRWFGGRQLVFLLSLRELAAFMRTIKRAANRWRHSAAGRGFVAWRGATVQRRRVAAIAQRAFDYSDHSMMRNALLRLRVFKKFAALSRRAAMLTSEGKRRRALVDAFRKLRLAGDKFRTAARLLTKLATPMCLHLAFLRFATALRRQGRPSRKSLLLQRKAAGRWRMDDLRRCWHILRLVCDTRAKRLVAQAFARGHHRGRHLMIGFGHWATRWRGQSMRRHLSASLHPERTALVRARTHDARHAHPAQRQLDVAARRAPPYA